MDFPSPTNGLHLEHPPQRTVSLMRAKELHSLASQHSPDAPCSITDSFLSKLKFPTTGPTFPEPCADWANDELEPILIVDDEVIDLENATRPDNSILLPSTPRAVPWLEPTIDGVVKLEPDEDLDFHIPLMTSLFYQEDRSWAHSRQNTLRRQLHRNVSINSDNRFPRDALSWYISPAITPRTASPCISPPSTSVSHDSRITTNKSIRVPCSGVTQAIGHIHPVMNSHDATRTSLKRRSPQSRRTKRTKADSQRRISPSNHSPVSENPLPLNREAEMASPWMPPAPAATGRFITAGNHVRTRQLPLPPLIPPRSPIRRPLPPKPSPDSATTPPSCSGDHSFLSLTFRDSEVTNLMSLVDKMIMDTEPRLVDRTAITAH